MFENQFNRRLALFTFSWLALVLIAPSASAQTAWPAKPIKIVVPFGPGGSTDLVARIVATELSKAFPQPFVVDNRAGAGGNVAADIVAHSAPDGYTLLLGTVGTHAINQSLYSKIPYNPQKDFAPITMVASVPNVMIINADNARALGINNVMDFIIYAKSNPGKLNMASGGNGTSTHLSGEMFKSRAGVFMTHIPYTSAAPALLGVMSGSVDVMFDNLPSALPHIKSGKLKGLAVTSAQRSGAIPELPTVEEAGQLKGFDAGSWFGLLAPAGTPVEIVNRIQQEVARALVLPAVREKLLVQGAIPGGSTPAEFAKFVGDETKKWASVVKASGAKVD